jgi:hypothetical protein
MEHVPPDNEPLVEDQNRVKINYFIAKKLNALASNYRSKISSNSAQKTGRSIEIVMFSRWFLSRSLQQTKNKVFKIFSYS